MIYRTIFRFLDRHLPSSELSAATIALNIGKRSGGQVVNQLSGGNTSTGSNEGWCVAAVAYENARTASRHEAV